MTNHPNRGRKYFGSIRVQKPYIGAKSNAVLTPLEAMKLIEWFAGSINSNAQTITLSTKSVSNKVLESGAEALPMAVTTP
jgi:hypothetical protein